MNSNSSQSAISGHNNRAASDPSYKRHQISESNYYLASGGCDCNIIVWDLISLTAVCKFRGHKDAVTDLTFLSVNGRKLLVSVSKDTLLKVWCMDTQSCIQTVVGHRCEIWSVALIGDEFSPSTTSDTDADINANNSAMHTQTTLTIVTGSSDDVLRGYSVVISASHTKMKTADLNNRPEENDDTSREGDDEETVLRYIGNIATQCAQDKIVRLSMNMSG